MTTTTELTENIATLMDPMCNWTRDRWGNTWRAEISNSGKSIRVFCEENNETAATLQLNDLMAGIAIDMIRRIADEN